MKKTFLSFTSRCPRLCIVGSNPMYILYMIVLVYLFSIILLVSSVMVIVVRNPLHAVLSLVMSFLSASILLFLFENEFFALFFLIIYLGAIAILFLFVIMMLNIKYRDLQNSRLYFPAGIFIGATLLIQMEVSLSKVFTANTGRSKEEHNLYFNWYDGLDSLIDTAVLGQIFYTHYVLQLLMAGLILYVAVIGVAFLTIKSAFTASKKSQSIFRQLSRNNIL
jgi:NADH-quinone oxidoreductase subunit J